MTYFSLHHLTCVYLLIWEKADISVELIYLPYALHYFIRFYICDRVKCTKEVSKLSKCIF